MSTTPTTPMESFRIMQQEYRDRPSTPFDRWRPGQTSDGLIHAGHCRRGDKQLRTLCGRSARILDGDTDRAMVGHLGPVCETCRRKWAG